MNAKNAMPQTIQEMTNYTLTENCAKTHASTLSDCLDLFATIGALRHQSEEEISLRFMRAHAEDATLAMKTLFFARDIRGGLGERRTFRVLLKWLAQECPASLRKNLALVPEYGRFDDWLALLDTPLEGEMLALLKTRFDQDITACEQSEAPSLLGKWLPSANASNQQTKQHAKRVAKALGVSEKAYRQALSMLRSRIRIIENNLRTQDYSFDYEKQPSRAMLKYRQAFNRNDGERYQAFMEKVKKGEAKLNTSALTPYDLVLPILRNNVAEKDRESLQVSWQSLEDFTSGENALCVVDGSGSMYAYDNPIPAAVALSLGIYYAQRNQGAFHNQFITFSENPRLVTIKGQDVYEQVRYCERYNEVANTNIQRVFELVLDAALRHKASPKEMPKTLYIISDMEFDCCAADADVTNFQYAKALFESHGYPLPQVVFWNVASRNTHQPVLMNEQGVALVSGFTPRLFQMLAKGDLNPMRFMLETLNAPRYAAIAA